MFDRPSDLTIKTLALASLLMAAPAIAQDIPDIGFKSVGRGRPLAASVQGKPEVGPNWVRTFGQQYDPAHPFPLNGYPHDALPKDYKPLPRDINWVNRFSLFGEQAGISAASKIRQTPGAVEKSRLNIVQDFSGSGCDRQENQPGKRGAF